MNEPGYEKLLRWCTYRDRCIFETQLKCKEIGLDKDQTEKIISRLMDENFLDEERFACQYVHSKSVIKKWGRQKIYIELKRKKIAPEIIQRALVGIEDEMYQNSLFVLAEKKWNSIKELHPGKKKLKLRVYLYQKGYTGEDIQQAINWLIK